MRAEWSSPRGDIAGLGYVERLEMTLPPWQLPIEELRWGRFTAESADAAWIEWRGPQPLRLAWRNGAEVDSVDVAFKGRSTLREGPLAKTVFSKVPVLRKSLPVAMLSVDETKWRSRATLQVPGADPVSGWAIHEVVKW